MLYPLVFVVVRGKEGVDMMLLNMMLLNMMLLNMMLLNSSMELGRVKSCGNGQ